nr:unnamed protein product [Callosobruchus chinensis]CAH7767675.1 unnamed protein product [Callosobruchus chinensis]
MFCRAVYLYQAIPFTGRTEMVVEVVWEFLLGIVLHAKYFH